MPARPRHAASEKIDPAPTRCAVGTPEGMLWNCRRQIVSPKRADDTPHNCTLSRRREIGCASTNTGLRRGWSPVRSLLLEQLLQPSLIEDEVPVSQLDGAHPLQVVQMEGDRLPPDAEHVCQRLVRESLS